MALDRHDPPLRRKLTPRKPAPEGTATDDAGPAHGPASGLLRAVSRVLSASTPLMAEDASLHRKRASLPELLDAIEPDAFVVTLAGGDSVGLALIDQSGFASLIEAMTIGRLSARPSPPRRATTTDSALLAGFLDSVLADLGADPVARHRCGRAMPDHRLIGVLLDDGEFDLVALTARLVCAQVSRPVRVMLALPRGAEAVDAAASAEPAKPGWTAALEAAVLAAPTNLRAELGRVTLPLAEVLELGVGSALILPLSALEDIRLVGLDGVAQATGRLGQSRGIRALRLTHLSVTAPPDPPMQEATAQLRGTGDAGALPALHSGVAADAAFSRD